MWPIAAIDTVDEALIFGGLAHNNTCISHPKKKHNMMMKTKWESLANFITGYFEQHSISDSRLGSNCQGQHRDQPVRDFSLSLSTVTVVLLVYTVASLY